MNPTRAVLCLLLLASCRVDPPTPKRSEEAWSATVQSIDRLNGMTCSFELEGQRLSGMREGSRLPVGTRVVSQPGVIVRLRMSDDSELLLDGGSTLQLDPYSKHGVKLLRGRMALSATGDATLGVSDESLATKDASLLVEAFGGRSEVAVLRGTVYGAGENVARGQVLVLDDGAEVFAATDIAERTAWFDSADSHAGYGEATIRGATGEVIDGGMSLTEHLVGVELVGGFAETRITEAFKNDSGGTVNLRYSFTLPDGATLTEIAVEEDGGWLTSAVETKNQATRTYNAAKHEGKRAVLMNARDGVASVNVANIGTGQVRRVRVTYVSVLRGAAGKLRYRYQMPRDGEARLRAQRFAVDVHAGVPAKGLAVVGYGATVAAADGGATASFEAGDFVPAGDLNIVVDTPAATVVRENRGTTDFVALTLRPGSLERRERRPMDIFVAADVSGNRAQYREQLEDFLQALIAERAPDDRLIVVACAARCTPLTGKELGEPEALSAPLNFGGVTNVSEVARVARAVFEEPPKRGRAVLYISDAEASAGAIRPARSASFRADLTASGAALHVLDFAEATPAAAELATVGGGALLQVDPAAMVSSARAAFAAVSAPLVSTPAVKLPAGFELVQPEVLRPVLRGQVLTLMARAPKGTALTEVDVAGLVGGSPFEQTFKPVELTTKRRVPSTLWASNRITALEATGEEQDAAAAAEVSRELGVLSRRTSFVAVGAEKVVDKSRRQPRAFGRLDQNITSGITERGIGLANVGTAGRGGGGRGGHGYTKGAADLGSRGARVPRVVPGRPAVQGSLDKEIIRRVVRQHRRELKYCYQQAAFKEPNIRGRVVFRFTIAASGGVVSAVVVETTLNSSAAERCMAGKIRRWVFPEPKGGGIVIVSYPFNFTGLEGPATATEEVDEPAAPAQMRTIVSERSQQVKPATSTSPEVFEWIAAVNGLDPWAIAGPQRMLRVRRDDPWRNIRERALRGDENRAIEAARILPERLPRDVATHRRLAFLLKDPALACAHAQAAASLDGGGETCPMTSTAWRDGAAKFSMATPDGEVDLAVSVDAPGVRLLLVRADGERSWWLESDVHRDCVLEEDRESCEWRALQPGVYAVVALPPTRRAPEKATASISYQGAKPRKRVVELSDGVVMTFVHGDVTVHAPEVAVPDRIENAAAAKRAFGRLRRAAAFCAGRKTSVQRFEVDVAFQALGVQVRRVAAAPTRNKRAEGCMREYVEALAPPTGVTQPFEVKGVILR